MYGLNGSFVVLRNMTEMMTTVSLQIVGIIEPIIQHADWFFPGGEKDTQSVSLTLSLTRIHTFTHTSLPLERDLNWFSSAILRY